MNYWENRFQAALLGVLIGDALGQPVETMTAERILSATGGKGITTFIDAIQRGIPSQANLKAGATTDDWQLTKKITESLIACGEFNLLDIAKRHVAAYRECRIGWGGTTEYSVKELVDFQVSGGKKGRNPIVPVTSAEMGRGAGNGVAMKIAPLVLFDWYSTDEKFNKHGLTDHIRRLTLLTHADPRALYTTLALALAEEYVLINHIQDSAGALRMFDAVMKTMQLIADQPGQYGYPNEPETFSQLRRLRPLIGDAKAIEREIKPGFIATESVIYAIGIFLTYPTDFRTAILTAVNAGYDSDTTAAIIGAISGMNNGLAAIPEDWRAFFPWYGEAVVLGTQLFHAATKKKKSLRQQKNVM